MSIQEILDEGCKELGQEQNTLLFFIGDNGAPLGNAWDGSLNVPMVGQKGMVAEGGIRTPFVAAWPGTWPAGVVYDRPVISLDVAATAVALAGLPPDPQLDGVNLTPFVTGQNPAAPHERLFWRWGSQAAVLEMPYKLIKLGNRPPPPPRSGGGGRDGEVALGLLVVQNHRSTDTRSAGTGVANQATQPRATQTTPCGGTGKGIWIGRTMKPSLAVLTANRRVVGNKMYLGRRRSPSHLPAVPFVLFAQSGPDSRHPVSVYNSGHDLSTPPWRSISRPNRRSDWKQRP